MKRILTITLTLAMLLAFAPPASASEWDDESPVIEVVVPETGHVVINPYGLSVTLEGQETTEQVASGTMVLENRSDVAVDVSISAVGRAYGGVEFASRPPAPESRAKELFLYAEFQPLAYFDAEPYWSGSFADGADQILVTSYGLWKDGVMRLEAIGEPYSWGAARLFGSAALYPEQPWDADDGFRAELAFTFTPVGVEPPVLDELPEEPTELPDDPVIDETPDEIQEEEPAPPEDDPVELPSEEEPEPIPEPEVPPEPEPDESETPVPDPDIELNE